MLTPHNVITKIYKLITSNPLYVMDLPNLL